jgi:hypothetical protein
MRLRATHLLLAFGLGLGCAVIFTFPAWSLGTIRSGEEATARGATVAKLTAPELNDTIELPHLLIDTSSHSLTVTVPGKDPVVVKAQGAYALTKGSFSIARKEVNPLWQAPPTYFMRRGLAVPEEGSSARSMRGALGPQAFFLSQAVAIHSGPVWNDDVGGVKLSSADMAMIFDVVSVGAAVEVR